MSELLLSSYFGVHGGAANDSTDCTAALQAAVNDAASANGGTIVFPSGICRLAGTITKDFIANQGVLVFKGEGGAAVRFMTVEYNRFTITNMEKISFRDLVFLGDNGGLGANVEATNAHFLCGAIQTVFENCIFYGLLIDAAGQGIIFASGSLVMRDCQMLGCAGPIIVRFNTALGVHLFNTQFIDYGTYGNLYISKTPVGVGVWVSGINGVQTNARELSRITIDGCSFDEGAVASVQTDGVRYIDIRNSAQNIGTGVGMFFTDARSVTIDQTWFGYHTTPNRVAVKCEDVTQLEMNNCMMDAGADKIELLGSTAKAIFNNVQRDGVPLVVGDITNTAGADIELDGVRRRGSLVQIG